MEDADSKSDFGEDAQPPHPRTLDRMKDNDDTKDFGFGEEEEDDDDDGRALVAAQAKELEQTWTSATQEVQKQMQLLASYGTTAAGGAADAAMVPRTNALLQDHMAKLRSLVGHYEMLAQQYPTEEGVQAGMRTVQEWKDQLHGMEDADTNSDFREEAHPPHPRPLERMEDNDVTKDFGFGEEEEEEEEEDDDGRALVEAQAKELEQTWASTTQEVQKQMQLLASYGMETAGGVADALKVPRTSGLVQDGMATLRSLALQFKWNALQQSSEEKVHKAMRNIEKRAEMIRKLQLNSRMANLQAKRNIEEAIVREHRHPEQLPRISPLKVVRDEQEFMMQTLQRSMEERQKTIRMGLINKHEEVEGHEVLRTLVFMCIVFLLVCLYICCKRLGWQGEDKGNGIL